MSGSRDVELRLARLFGGAEDCVRGSGAVGVARDWHASSDEPRAEGGGGGRSHEWKKLKSKVVVASEWVSEWVSEWG